MTSDEAVLAMLDALEGAGIEYMLVGSFSSNFYGVPRATRDVDFVVQFDDESIFALRRQLPAGLLLDPQLSFETVTTTQRYVIKLVDRPFKIELFLLSDDPHDQERFRRRTKARVLDRDVSLPTPEDVIIAKLRWAKLGRRHKDLDDVQKVLGLQGALMDWHYLSTWCERHGTLDLLEDLRRQTPSL